MKNPYTGMGKRHSVMNAKQEEILEGQVENSCGAAVYEAADIKKLEMFLVLGSEGGSYYANEKKLTVKNYETVEKLVKEDGITVVNKVVDVSVNNKAPKNDPALFVLAMASALGDEKTRNAAFDALPQVARIGTHLFHFMEFRKQFAGSGRKFKRAIAKWYNEKSVDNVAFQIGKYQQRDGWCHHDVMHIAHPRATDGTEPIKRNIVYKWAKNGCTDGLKEASSFLYAYEEVKATDNQKEVERLVKEYKLPLEMVPTDKRSDKIYRTMLDNFKMTALIKNLGVLSSRGILQKGKFDEIEKVCEKVTDKETLCRERIHPLFLLVALRTYASGKGFKGKLSWAPVSEVVDALDEAFYNSFEFVEPTNKRHLLALDVSGSMDWSSIAGMSITPREASAAMALITKNVEKRSTVMAFANNFMDIDISSRERLDDVINKVSKMDFGRTDCSLPMKFAEKNRIPIDAFIVYTDSETNCYDEEQPMVALKRYRNIMGINSKLIVVGMVSNGFSIADPNDSGSLDVIGFSVDTPKVISQFVFGI